MRRLLALTLCSTLLVSCAHKNTNTAEGLFDPQKSQAQAESSMGVNEVRHQQFALAKPMLEQAIKDDPKLASSWYSMAYYYEVSGNTQKAEGYYKKAIQVEPNSGSAHNDYGTFLCRQRRLNECYQQFQLAASSKDFDNVASAYENSGLAALLMKNDALAKDNFIKALKLNPSLSTSTLELARIYHHLGKDDQAKYYLNAFKKMHPKKDGEAKELYNEIYYGARPPQDLPNPA